MHKGFLDVGRYVKAVKKSRLSIVLCIKAFKLEIWFFHNLHRLVNGVIAWKQRNNMMTFIRENT